MRPRANEKQNINDTDENTREITLENLDLPCDNTHCKNYDLKYENKVCIIKNENEDENEKLLQLAKSHKDDCLDVSTGHLVWLGLVKRDHTWYEVSSGEPSSKDYYNWKYMLLY